MRSRRVWAAGGPAVMAMLVIRSLAPSPLAAQGRPAAPGGVLDTTTFRLARTDAGYELHHRTVGGPMVRRRVPGAWLTTGSDPEAPPFDTAVTAFPLDDRRTGLHLMAYEISREGAAGSASGRDAILVLDGDTGALGPLLSFPDATRGRTRATGCWSAWDVRILLGDVNGDAVLDIGVIRRTLRCGIPEAGLPAHPSYREAPVHWWVSDETAWVESGSHDGLLPAGYRELPARGLQRSPVDWALDRIRGRS